MSDRFSNWAGNIVYAPRAVKAPGNLDQLVDAVLGADKARALGSRHSFNAITDSDATLISMRRLTGVRRIDREARTVTVEGGITYGQLCPVLEAEGLALHNLASLPHISVVGACATATHGSGDANRNLAAAVAGLELVTADGDVITLARGDEGFEGAVVGLGAVGIVSAVTLDLQPSFTVRQNLFRDLRFDTWMDNFDAITASGYSVSVFTAWRGDTADQVWVKTLASEPAPGADFFGARAADAPLHPIAALDPAPCTAQLGEPGPWFERLPHFRIEHTPSAGAELQSEYFVAREDAPAALRALRAIQDRIAPHLLISEIRTIAADDLWMSMACGGPRVGIHFTWKLDWPAVEATLHHVEAALAPFAPRPHWGKLFVMNGADVRARYPRLGDFRELCETYDPLGKFRNAFLDDCVF